VATLVRLFWSKVEVDLHFSVYLTLPHHGWWCTWWRTVVYICLAWKPKHPHKSSDCFYL